MLSINSVHHANVMVTTALKGFVMYGYIDLPLSSSNSATPSELWHLDNPN
jgi:uncharacterized protein YunC (DUF1805 family)